jgi:hypothetical protein
LPRAATLFAVLRPIATAVAALALALVAAGCDGGSSSAPPPTATTAAAKPTCPAAWRSGWQGLANEIHADVYCPSWLPDPLDGRFGGPSFGGRHVDPDRSYLIGFIWFKSEGGLISEVHINFRGYPGRAAIPVCEDTLTVNGKTVHPKMPCFADGRTRKRFGQIRVTVYTANQGADQWHILYAWHRRGSLYTLSEHVAPPYTRAEVVANLDRMMRGLVLLQPSS